jgi:hypothetical protein
LPRHDGTAKSSNHRKPGSSISEFFTQTKATAMSTAALPEIPLIRTFGDLLDSLRAEDEDRNTVAAALCHFLVPQRFAHPLVLELANPNLPIAYRIRIANALECLGELPDPDDRHMLMAVLIRDKNEDLQHAIVHMMMGIRRRDVEREEFARRAPAGAGREQHVMR